jgi:hypothetical protein
MWDNHVKPASFPSNDQPNVQGSDDHQEDGPLIEPTTRVHGESWMGRANDQLMIGEIWHAKGPQCGSRKRKKIDVLPVEVRAMAFRVQAGILRCGSRPEGTKQ